MTTTQHIASDPARRLADKIRARTNNGQDLIDLLHNISQGGYNANKNDRVTAAKYLFDRGYGKCPKQPPAPSTEPEQAPESAESDNHANHSSDTPQTAVPHGGPDSPRLVTQVEDALTDSLGPAPSAHTPISPSRHSGEEAPSTTRHSGEEPPTTRHSGEEPPTTRHSGEGRNPEGQGGASPDPFDPFSIQTSIQDYIIQITNDGDTLVDTLIEIAYADEDDTTVTSYHRTRAGKILADRGLGTDPNAARSAICPDCRRRWTTHLGSTAHPQPSTVEEEPFDKEVWDEIIAEINQLEADGIITPDPNAPKIDISSYLPPEDYVMPPEVAAEEAAKFRAEIKLRLERQKQWPEIEERRRKKLAQIYPSHSDEQADPPDP